METTKEDCVIFTRLHENAIIPWRSTKGSAGYDLFSPIDIKISSREIVKIPLDIAMKIPADCFCTIVGRSSEMMRTLHVYPRYIDSDYYGNIEIDVQNTDKSSSIKIVKHAKLAQMIITKKSDLQFKEISNEEFLKLYKLEEEQKRNVLTTPV